MGSSGGVMNMVVEEEEKSKVKVVVFALNGERVEASSFDPSTTLLEFIRTETRFKGPKLGCGEGGCGACVVLLSRYDKKTKQVEDFSISSCLTLLYSIDGCSITTTEGLGNVRNGFHPIHERFSGFHASQCGFCTPGMCMSFFASLVNADKKADGGTSVPGFSNLNVSEAEKAVSGNLCRCTGYRPIVDACKSFAHDVDMEDLGLNSFWNKGEKAGGEKLPPYVPNAVCTFPEFLKEEIEQPAFISSSLQTKTVAYEYRRAAFGRWAAPKTMEELVLLLELSAGSEEGDVKLVVGNTSKGVYREEDYHSYIDLRNISELSEIKRNDEGVEIGAALSISKVIETLQEEGKLLGKNGSVVYTKLADHMSKVASKFVRNTASLGGNLILSQRKRFASDIATVLLGANSSVKVQTGKKKVCLSLEEFLEQPPCGFNTVLISVSIPSYSQSSSSYLSDDRRLSGKRLLFETYRAAVRPLGNAVSYLNAAFLVQVSGKETEGNCIVENLQLAFGAYGTKHAIRVRKVEEFIVGKMITPSVLLEAIALLREIVVPDPGTPEPAYRSSLAVGFLFEFFYPLMLGNHIPHHPEISIDASNEDVLRVKGQQVLSIISGRQEVGVHNEYHPVGQPTKKVAAELQASGEAVYVDDIPSPKDCLHGAYVYSVKPLARIEKIDIDTSSQGLIELVTYRDVPKGGQNLGSFSIFGGDPLFAEDTTEFVGQPIGILVAETRKDALNAVKKVKVHYSIDGLEKPILSVEDAVSRSSLFEIPEPVKPKPIGDFLKGMSEAEHKIVSAEVKFASQYYFYMETQAALAIPDEDNCMTVYTSNQVPETCQLVVAKCLGVPEHNVRVITRRVGGGFGGKAFKAVPVATACALAAHKLGRPVRIYVDRKTDMIMFAGRHPMKVTFSVGFKEDGRITALHLDLLIDAGITEDVSPILPLAITESLKKYDWQSLSFDVKVCKTNFVTKSAMRAPGDVQGAFIAEAVVEQVASYLSLDASKVRKKNMHTFESLKLFYQDSHGELPDYTLPMVFDKLIESSHFYSRAEVVKHFNDTNRWRKRGISMVPIVYKATVRPTPGKVSVLNDGSVVVEVGGVELGQGLWTKVKQMAAYGLGKLWNDGSQDLFDRVRVIQADTLSLVQGGWTAGSTTSESSSEAVRLACSVLVERLTPIFAQLQANSHPVSWDALIKQAHLQSVNLSASSYFVPEPASASYLNYGAAASEVEVDLLTGAVSFLRTDIVYDSGLSLNPAVDLGQIEGSFVQGVGFFMLEEYVTEPDGKLVTDGTWTYKIPTVDTIPRQFNVEILNTGHHKNRVLSSKASGEPLLLLASSVHCATREAIRAARRDLCVYSGLKELPASFRMDVPAPMHVIKELCGLDNVEMYLKSLVAHT